MRKLGNFDIASKPFVCPSATRRYCVEMANHQTFSPLPSHTILVFFVPNFMAIFRRDSPNGNGYGDFRPISRFISEMVQDKASELNAMERQ